MENYLTLAEIEERYPNEWVLLDDFQTNDKNQTQGGHLLYHSPDRDEVDRQVLALRPQRFAVFYTGTVPEETAIIL